jgi:moderate conductance mechanosensitive channel
VVRLNHVLTNLSSASPSYVRLPADPSVGRPGTLNYACGSTKPSTACQIVWDVTHSTHAARVADTFFAGPVQVGLRVLFVIALALVVRLFARRVINRITSRATLTQDNVSERSRRRQGERRAQRASALGSVLGNAASVTIFMIAGFIILGDLGLNLAPVLASAGVLGIAVGFGAQNLVQDFFAGVFILLEDQYGVGDVIDIADISGTVEAVSLRITRVRDVNGVIWFIRNGTISKSGNESHGWARAVVDFPVPYDLDIGEVRGLMESTAVLMWQDPAWQTFILERPEVWGVQEVTSDSVLVRVIARTAPLKQWEVGRELRERLKVALMALSPTADTAALTETESGGSGGSGTEVPGSASGGPEPPAGSSGAPAPGAGSGT